MPLHQWMSARVGRVSAAAVALTFSVISMALVYGGSPSRAAAQTPGKLEATVFSFDGKDFVRTKTTMVTEQGQSAVNTKLDHDTPAYKALIQKHSYSGDATVFGRKYDANYAPLTGADGRLTGALFVAVAK